jgi:hypothetical protein
MIAGIESGESGYDIPLIVALGKIKSKDAVPLLAEIAQGRRRRKGVEARDLEAELARHRAVDAWEHHRLRRSGSVLVQLLDGRFPASVACSSPNALFAPRLDWARGGRPAGLVDSPPRPARTANSIRSGISGRRV